MITFAEWTDEKKEHESTKQAAWDQRVRLAKFMSPYWIADVGHDITLHVDWSVRAVQHSNGQSEVVVQIADDGSYTTKTKAESSYHSHIFESLLAMDEDTYKKTFCYKDSTTGEWYYRTIDACAECRGTDIVKNVKYFDYNATPVLDEMSCTSHKVSNVGLTVTCRACKHYRSIFSCSCGMRG
jgi:hypothetical protein